VLLVHFKLYDYIYIVQ